MQNWHEQKLAQLDYFNKSKLENSFQTRPQYMIDFEVRSLTFQNTP